MHLGLWTRQCASPANLACIMMSIAVWIVCAYLGIYTWDCEPRMYPDVYISLCIMCYAYMGIFTWNIRLQQDTSLANHDCFMMCIVVCILFMRVYRLWIVNSKSRHHLWTTHASWCLLYSAYKVVRMFDHTPGIVGSNNVHHLWPTYASRFLQ